MRVIDLALVVVVASGACTQKQEQVPVDRQPANLPKPLPSSEDKKSRFPFDNDPATSPGSSTSDNATRPDQGGSAVDTGGGGAVGGGAGSGAGGSSGNVGGAVGSGSIGGGQSSGNPGGNTSTGGTGSSGNGGSSTGGGISPGQSTSVNYVEHIKPIFDRACISCHATGKSRAQSPMENYTNAKANGDLANLFVESGRMPPPNLPQLSAAEKKLVKDWVAAGKPERASSSSTSTSPTTPSDLELAGNWTGEKDEFSNQWTVSDVQPGAVAPAPSSSPAPGNSSTGGGGAQVPPTTPTLVTYEKDIKPILDRSCVSCHRPGGSYARLPLNTFAAASRSSARVNARIQAGTMPTSGPLGATEKTLVDKWIKDGALERAPAGGAQNPGGGVQNPSGGSQPDSGAQGQVVNQFRIKAGTGSGAWNTKETEVVVKVGSQFTIYNDDSVVHQWHTNGAPCAHGNPIQPGRSAACTVNSAYSGTPVLYDHNTRGQFFIRAER